MNIQYINHSGHKHTVTTAPKNVSKTMSLITACGYKLVSVQ